MRAGVLIACFLAGLCAAAQAQEAPSFCDSLRSITAPLSRVWVDETSREDRETIETFLLHEMSDRDWYTQARKLRVTKSERMELHQRAQSFSFDRFRPRCSWASEAHNFVQSLGFPIATFSNPLFSSDHKLAVVALSIHMERGLGSQGQFCAIRKIGNVWKSRCTRTWIS
jgi:hypothetical protein